VYLLVFTIALVGPVRLIEERHLRRTFANAEAYMAGTPGYFPRVRKVERRTQSSV
jgi:hypothetical protein